MGRPPQPPRSYVTRHIRFRRATDAAIQRAMLVEQRGFNDLVRVIVEEWLRDRGELPPLEPPRQPRKPPRKP
jgi:hypothetical protein